MGNRRTHVTRHQWRISIMATTICLGAAAFAQAPTPKPSAPTPFEQWRNSRVSLYMNDFGELARYRDENARLKPPAPEEKRVVFYGDSITDGWPLPEYFPGKPYVNRGISGQTTAQMLVRFQQDVIALQPKAVVILAGTNDIAGNTGATSLAIIQGNIASMAELARAHGVRVILASILPVAQYGWHSQVQPIASVTAMNEWLRAYAAREHCTYVDYYAVLNDGRGGFKAELAYDGVHPNPAGYAAMHGLAEAAIAQALAR